MTSPTAEDYALAERILAGEVELDERQRCAVESLLFGEDLRSFMGRVSPHLEQQAHLQPVVDAIESCVRSPQRICISMPPRHGKTVTLQHGIAWWLSRFPRDLCGYYSFNVDAGHAQSSTIRDIARGAGLQVGAADARDGMGEWRIAGGGGLLAGGRGSALTGRGLQGLFIVDDPFKDVEEAYSQTIRDKTFDWFNTVGMTRLEGASAIVTHTRWHEDDLIGRLAQKGWRVINLPALAEPGDPLGRLPGEALWPSNPEQTREKLLALKAQIGEFYFAALFQGAPRPLGHNVFNDPAYYHPGEFRLAGKHIVLAVDPAASEKTAADYSALVVLAIEPEPHGHPELRRAWVLEVHRKQMSVPNFARLVLEVQKRYGGATVHVETVAGFKAVPQIMRDIAPGVSVEDHDPDGDKFQRAQLVASAWNGGRVLLPTAAPWLADFLTEVKRFTGVGSKKDDQVDALSTAWNAYTPPVVYRRFATVGGGRRM